MNFDAPRAMMKNLGKRVMLLLIVALVAEIAWLGTIVLKSNSVAPESQNALSVLGIEIAQPLNHPPISAYNEIMRRPLFESDRRQIIENKSSSRENAANSQFSGDWRLTGVAIGENRSVAILENKKTGKVLSLANGDTVDGWSIETINAEKVVLRNGANKREFALDADENRAMSIAERNGVLVRSE